VIQVTDTPQHPVFCRVILNAHIAEMTDLPAPDRMQLMHVVWAVERALRETGKAGKINLASLGNVVPHLHWHVIARYPDDVHFPQPIWGAPQRAASPPAPTDWAQQTRQRLAAWLA
jgi:diadenosine tetraphosphate (Ap4A) HIT family hydrolase